MEDIDNHVEPGNMCAGEVVLRNAFLIASGIDVKDFLANNIERLASIGHGNLDGEEPTAKVGKLGFKLLSQEINVSEKELEPSKLCSMMANASFPHKYGATLTAKKWRLEFKMKMNL